MTAEAKVIALGAGLVLLVSIAMCVGLSGDDEVKRASRAAAEETEEGPAAAAEEEGEREPEPDQEPIAEEPDEEQDPGPPLDAERILLGTVTDKRDLLLEGAEVMIEGFSRLRDISASDGSYQLHSVPNRAETLVVTVTGYAEARVALEPGEPDSRQRVDVQLEDGDGVAGSVVDPEGKPVDGAQVRCAGKRDPALETETDRYGRFELPKRAAGCDGMARHSSHADSPRVELKLGAGNLIALARQGSVSGVVVDKQGNPVRSFVIAIEDFKPEVEGTDGRRYRQPYNNASGRFTVRDLAPGTYVFSVAPQVGRTFRSKPIQVKSGEQVKNVRLVVP